MPALYAPPVKAALEALRAAIQARAAADGVAVGEVLVGGRAETAGQSYQPRGIYVLPPDDRDPKYLANRKRDTTLVVLVYCRVSGFTEPDGTLGVIDLTGVVKDAVHADHTVGGTCSNAVILGSTPASDDDLTTFLSEVQVQLTLIMNTR